MILVLVSFLREWYRHPIQLGLSIFGIAIGVATIVAIDLSNHNASDSFRKSNSLLNGLATHRITGGVGGINQDIFTWLKVEMKIYDATPVIEARVVIVDDNQSVKLLGIEPLSDRRIRSLDSDWGMNSVSAFPIFVSSGTQQRYANVVDSRLNLSFGGNNKIFTISGTLQSDSEVLDNVLITDIAAAQIFLNLGENISYVDLRLRKEEIERIQSSLPVGVYLADLNAKNHVEGEMSRAFQTNLEAMGLLALVVGVFLVFNTVSFQMLRRKGLFTLLRVLGLTHTRLFVLLMAEAFLLGLVGTVLGSVLGVLLSQVLYGLVTNTINTLYFDLAQQTLEVPAFTLVKATLLGIGASLLAVAYPAWKSRGRTLTAQLVHNSTAQSALVSIRSVWFAITCTLMAAGTILFGNSLLSAFFALFLLIVGMCFPLPFIVSKIAEHIETTNVVVSRPSVLLGVRSIRENLSRTSLAAIALSIAVATTLGVSLMIDSFRYSVDHWLNNYLRADIYISASRSDSAAISPTVLEKLSGLDNVISVSRGSRSSVPSNLGSVDLFVLDTELLGFKGFQIKQGDSEGLWNKFRDGDGALISEALSSRMGLEPGDTIRLNTDSGFVLFTIAAIYFDYSSEHGVVTLHDNSWKRYNTAIAYRSAALYLNPSADKSVHETLDQFERSLNQNGLLFARSNKALKRSVLEVFDQTFEITGILRLLTILIAISAIVSALLCVQLERRHQLSILRAIGFTRLDLVVSTQIHTGLLGLVIGVFSIPIGITLSTVLINVINQRSFGWSMHTILSPSVLGQSLTIAIVSALIAGMLSTFHLRNFDIAHNLKRD